MACLGGLPLVTSHARNPKGWEFATKYALDRAAAVVILALLAPLFGIFAFAVLLSLGRPIFYRQERIGLDGRPFGMLKFRSMRPPDQAEPWVSYVCPARRHRTGGRRGRRPAQRVWGTFMRRALLGRATAARRTSLRGDMSLVGPPARTTRVRRAVRAAGSPLRRAPQGQVGDHRLGAGPRTPRPDVDRRPGRVGQLLHRELVALARSQDPAPDGCRGPPRPERPVIRRSRSPG